MVPVLASLAHCSAGRPVPSPALLRRVPVLLKLPPKALKVPRVRSPWILKSPVLLMAPVWLFCEIVPPVQLIVPAWLMTSAPPMVLVLTEEMVPASVEARFRVPDPVSVPLVQLRFELIESVAFTVSVVDKISAEISAFVLNITLPVLMVA
jgi:hypothetical protein